MLNMTNNVSFICKNHRQRNKIHFYQILPIHDAHSVLEIFQLYATIDVSNESLPRLPAHGLIDILRVLENPKDFAQSVLLAEEVLRRRAVGSFHEFLQGTGRLNVLRINKGTVAAERSWIDLEDY